ncbi:MAG: hypothetical protein FWC41_13260 [Firmicutes bacterium]|nr:hypothetical protein [Bacillota bacterium]
MKENLQKTTIIIEKETLKTLKKLAIDEEVTQNQLINEFIVTGIANKGKTKEKKEVY